MAVLGSRSKINQECGKLAGCGIVIRKAERFSGAMLAASILFYSVYRLKRADLNPDALPLRSPSEPLTCRLAATDRAGLARRRYPRWAVLAWAVLAWAVLAAGVKLQILAPGSEHAVRCHAGDVCPWSDTRVIRVASVRSGNATIRRKFPLVFHPTLRLEVPNVTPGYVPALSSTLVRICSYPDCPDPADATRAFDRQTG